ncbi:hypothetical protein J4210_03475 [Candidatus Woesearchaeota archaeon]|nr:hypothetical protein [Candidatus Woesearchaeota archaeon]
MTLNDLLGQATTTSSDCVFCDFSTADVGEKDSRGAVKVFQTGSGLGQDWYGILQTSVISDPKSGFQLLLVPLGHIQSFAEIAKDIRLAENYGIATARLSLAMQRIREEEYAGTDTFTPGQIIYGKCHTPQNSQSHLHLKLDEFSGGLAQAFPTDRGWIGKPTHYINEPIFGISMQVSDTYVRARPVTTAKLELERITALADRLINYAKRSI